MRQKGFGWGPTGVRCAQRAAVATACARCFTALALLLLYPAHANAAAAEGAPQIQAVDTQPDPFSFATVTNATPGIGFITEALTVTGITGPAPISVAGGAYKINDGPYLSQAGTVNLNDRVVFLVRSSTRSNKSVSGILTIGGISATFTVVTGDFDTAPDSFPFTPVTDAEQSKTYVSAPATITGITERAAIVVTGGRYRINGGNFTAEEGTVRVGDQVYAEVVASSKASTSTSATVTIGGVASVFKVTTAGTTDTVPNAFSFASVNEAETAATYISAPATISGINAPSPISVSGGRYRINNGNFTGLPGTVGAGDQIYVEVTAANLPGTAATATVTVGGVAGAFTVITAAAIDTVPDRFAFAPVDGAEPGTSYISAPATISGITGPSPISVSGGRYRINDGDFTDITGSRGPRRQRRDRGRHHRRHRRRVHCHHGDDRDRHRAEQLFVRTGDQRHTRRHLCQRSRGDLGHQRPCADQRQRWALPDQYRRFHRPERHGQRRR